nr:spermatogenesis-associated protein 20-like isoform X3 [Arachis hypogaea]XP_029152811.1 spermatogenesis-associated protein 20 isoform X2 [Arachis hypogaea]
MSDPHDEFKGKNVLIERKKSKDPSEITSKYSMSIETYKDILGECRRKLFEVRSRRARPHLDDKPKEYMQIAEKAALFIKKELHNAETQRLNHSFRNSPSKAPGFLDDYAFLISGLLDLYEFGGGINWLQWAIELQGTQDALFLDGDGGGYFNNTCRWIFQFFSV